MPSSRPWTACSMTTTASSPPCCWTRSPPWTPRSPSWAPGPPSWPRPCPPPGAPIGTAPPGPAPAPAGCHRAQRGSPAGRDPRAQPRPGPDHHRRDRSGHVPLPHRRPPGLVGGTMPVRPPVRAPHPGREEGPGRHLAARGPRPGRKTRPAPPPSSASATAGSPAAAARPRPRSPSPAPSWSSSGTCSLTPRPGSPTSAPATTRPAPTRTASSATTSGRSRRCWATPSPSPRPGNPIPPLTRPDHHTRPGSATARPFPPGDFPVSAHRGKDRVWLARLGLLDQGRAIPADPGRGKAVVSEPGGEPACARGPAATSREAAVAAARPW